MYCYSRDSGSVQDEPSCNKLQHGKKKCWSALKKVLHSLAKKERAALINQTNAMEFIPFSGALMPIVFL